MPAELVSTSQGKTLVLTVRHPELRNAFDPAIFAAGIEALSVAERSDEVRSVVITGADGGFSAGADLQRLLAGNHEGAQAQAQAVESLHNWIETIRTYPKPVIAAVEGTAAGAGFSLALACDLIVAARNASFVMAYSQIGLSPDGGVTWSLGRALPRQLASEILLCGERMEPARLHALGLVNRVVEPGQALQEAMALAQTLNERAPNALDSIKELLSEAPHNTLTAQLASERDHFVRNLHHPNAREGIAAFLEKRSPRY
ncbi:MAG: enoyl-CoA hydratase [Comamonadaceae bacterium]|nr:MAG: enoyl-CoA hydratase [Comamonadaceae bacterium]